jgi:hypothetical protein
MRFSDETADDDPWLEALRNAPVGKPLSDEERAELDHDMAELAAGRLVLIAHDDVPAWIEARAREEAELATVRGRW